MEDETKARAAARFDEARDRTGARDPRGYYRERLKELKGTDPSAYQAAVDYYNDELIPGVADGTMEPLGAWMEYGRRIAELTVEGRTVVIDQTGQSSEYRPPVEPDRLVLHLPAGGRGRALAVGLPPELSHAQQATYDLLVNGRQKLRDAAT